MRKNFFKGAALAAVALAGFTATAQEEESKGIELTGSVDTYFRTNLSGNNRNNDNGFTAPGTSFANQDGFALGFVNLIASKQAGKVGFVADLAFGPRGEDAVFNSENSSQIVNQLFVTYDASESVTLTLGNFNTFLGYEVISPTGNFNYSTSYLFSYGPFSHTGIKADYAINDNWSLMGAVLNATDFTDFNNGGKLTFGGQVGYSNDSGSAYLNVLYGRQPGGPGLTNDDETLQVDLTTGWDLSEDFYLGLNASINDTDGSGFYGVALYPQYSFTESFALGLRAEYFEVTEGGLDAGDVFGLDAEGEGNVFAATLTGSYTAGALTLKPELRLDTTSEDTFRDDNELNDSLFSFVLGAIYSF